MKRMVRGKTIFVSQPRLTAYPTGGYKTPGAGGAKKVFKVYHPVHSQIPSVLKQEKAMENEVKKQEGFGNPPDDVMETEGSSSSQKRKINEDVFKKMQHPIFKVSKIKKTKIEPELLTIGKGNDLSLTPARTETSAAPTSTSKLAAPASSSSFVLASTSKSNQEKKYFKF